MATDKQKIAEKIVTAEQILFDAETINLYALTRLCQQAYAKLPETAVGEWTFLSQSVPSAHGYYGVAYIHHKKQCVVIAHRGTDPALLSNLLSDASLAFSKLPEAQNDAKGFSEEIRTLVPAETLIIETGHSLGGFHAEMNIALLGDGYAMSFESPGTKDMCDTLQLHVNPDRFISFFSIPNVINTAKAHVGPLYQICTYRMDKNGLLKLDYISYLQPLTEALMKSATLVDSAARAGMSITKTTVLNVIKRQAQHHSLDSLTKAIHPSIGYPWLMRKVQTWPDLQTFLKAQTLASMDSVSSSSAKSTETAASLSEMRGYSPSDFVPAPHLDKHSPLVVQAYRVNALKRFDVFYSDLPLRQSFIQSMQLNVKEVAMVPAPAPRSARSSITATAAPSVQKASSASMPAMVAAPASSISSATISTIAAASPATANIAATSKPLQQLISNEPTEKVILVNSLIGNHLIEEKTWVISLLKSAGQAEHAFLLIEGIKNGVAIQRRIDFFLDTDARHETTAKLPVGISSSVNAAWGCVEYLVGRGFIRIRDLQSEEYERLIGICEHQSWSITQEKGEKFLATVAKEVEKSYIYAIPGNHPASSVTHSSGITVHNCTSWCLGVLKDVLDIHIGSKWSLVKRPSTIVRKAIQEDVQPRSSTLAANASTSPFSKFGVSGSQSNPSSLGSSQPSPFSTKPKWS